MPQSLLTLAVLLTLSSAVVAQEQGESHPSLLVELVGRVGALEEENRELRGQVEDARHELSQLSQRLETIGADVDYRLNNSESGAPSGKPSVEKPMSLMHLELENPEGKGNSSSPEKAYEKARDLLEQGDYAAAEHAFASFVKTYPKDEQAGAAQYWLGVTFFAREDYEKAASTFAKGYKNYPKSSKAGDNLLKLSKTLVALDRKADACATLEQLASEYPKSHKEEVASQRKKLKCNE